MKERFQRKTGFSLVAFLSILSLAKQRKYAAGGTPYDISVRHKESRTHNIDGLKNGNAEKEVYAASYCFPAFLTHPLHRRRRGGFVKRFSAWKWARLRFKRGEKGLNRPRR